MRVNRVGGALATLEESAADPERNLMPVLIACARADATLGEMVDVLRDTFGEFTEPALRAPPRR